MTEVLVSELMESLASETRSLVLKGLSFTSCFVFENRSVGQKEKIPNHPQTIFFAFTFYLGSTAGFTYCK